MTIALLTAHFEDMVLYRIYSGSGNGMEMIEEGKIGDIYDSMVKGNTSYTLTTVEAWHVSASGTLSIYIE